MIPLQGLFIRGVFALTLVPPAAGSPMQDAVKPVDPVDWAAPVVEAVMVEKRIPGVVVGVLRRGHMETPRAFGWSDVEAGVPMEAATLFQIGSLTKPMTATVAARLAQRGLVDLGAPIGDLLPAELALPSELAAITLEQLATHTSGLPREPVNRRDRPGSPSVMEPYSIDELYAGLQSTRLESEPGVRWSYSNLGYALLGHVLERASGEDFRSLLREELFGPLSMGDSGVTPTPEHEERLAVHYWPEDDVRTPRERWRMGEVVSAMGVYSNVQDLGRFLAALVEPEGPWVPIAAEMQTARVETGQQAGRQMSLGWLIDRVPGLGVVLGYGGEVDGHSGCIAFVPGAGAGLVVLCNQGDDSAEAVLRALMPLFVPQVLADGSAASTSDASNSAADPEAPIGQGGHGGR